MLKAILLVGASLFLFVSSAFAEKVIQDEYAKVQTDLETKLHAEKRTLFDLEQQKKKAIDDSKALAEIDRQGIQALKKYWTLTLNRYSGSDNKFQSWRAVTPKDVENINSLFETYLHSKPLSGRASAGMADRTLDWGMTRLEELAKGHGSPKPENNSELEIVSHQIADAETTIRQIEDQASRLGIKLRDRELAAEAPKLLPDAQ